MLRKAQNSQKNRKKLSFLQQAQRGLDMAPPNDPQFAKDAEEMHQRLVREGAE